MTRRRNKIPTPAGPRAAKSRAARLRLWCFRFAAVVLVPLLFLLLLEAALRLAGFGHPTSFLLPADHGGKKVFVQNNRFGWRFFGPDQSPQPACFAIPREKATNTIRIFVLGESAAFGDPQPDFGLPRLLQALLGERYPGVRFEVVNTAMVGINSHAILPIARDCAGASGDLWVLYMGNNEVVGPYGAGTVFGPQAPALGLIRAGLSLKATRTGQLFDLAARNIRRPPAGKGEWGGMLMFLENRVPANDARLAVAYRHFEKNLEDILAAGRRAGVGIVVSTVAVNLRDCAPFASAQRSSLGEGDQENWKEIYQRGVEAQQAGRMPEAVARFREAGQIDDTPAELQFRWGTAALALGDKAEAQRRFALARDLDTLRFRCDRKLNEITRRVAARHQQEGVLLADAEAALARQSPGGLPGSELFYEHVHLTFEGNYQLAWNLAEQIDKLLPETVRRRASAAKPWATPAECARRLAWTDASRLAATTDMLGRLHEPPFTGQIDHGAQLRRLMMEIERLRPAAQAVLRQGEEVFRDALATAPDDPVLFRQRAALQASAGDGKGAAESARRVIELLPHHAEAWAELGDALVLQQQFAPAADAYAEVLRREPGNFWARQNLARIYTKLGRAEDAMREFRRAIEIKPRFGPAHLGLGESLEAAGRKAEAEEHFRLALTHRVRRAGELTTLARFCHQRGWFKEALTNYLDAIQFAPAESSLRLGVAKCLVALERPAEADRYYLEAVRLDPDSGESRYLLGLALGRQGRPGPAAEQFREAVRLLPNLVEARVNLGVALMNLGQEAGALAEFEEVLRRSPTNAAALQHAQSLRSRPLEK